MKYHKNIQPRISLDCGCVCAPLSVNAQQKENYYWEILHLYSLVYYYAFIQSPMLAGTFFRTYEEEEKAAKACQKDDKRKATFVLVLVVCRHYSRSMYVCI